MKRSCALFGAALLAACLPSVAFAWGDAGHSVVAEIAQRNMLPHTREVIANTILQPGMSLASVASWADQVAHSTRKDTKGWHFVDLPLPQHSYSAEADCRDPFDKAPQKDNCIVEAIKNNAAIVGNTEAARQDRAEALKFVVHFVGDLHQPLHTVLEGRGGNAFRTRNPCKSKRACDKQTDSNLHSVWDSGLFRAQNYYAWGEIVDHLDAQYFATGKAEALLAGCASAQDVVCWTLASHAIAAKPGYMLKSGSIVTPEYVAMVKQDVDEQLVRAGLRLARLLDAELAQAPTTSTPSTSAAPAAASTAALPASSASPAPNPAH